MSRQVTIRKKQRTESVARLASDHWWINEIAKNQLPSKKIDSQWRVIICKAYAERDYLHLGNYVEGAPDHQLEQEVILSLTPEETYERVKYPRKLSYRPFWFPTFKSVDDYTFTLWLFLKNCADEDLVASKRSIQWYEHINAIAPDLQEELYYLLKRFQRPRRLITVSRYVKTQIDRAERLGQERIVNVIPEYPCKLPALNGSVQDWRPIPTDYLGRKIPASFLKWYLERRIDEWLALGAEKDQWQRVNQYYLQTQQGTIGRADLLQPFYWNVWANLSHFRNEFLHVEQAQRVLANAYRTRIHVDLFD